jgi:metal-sulfur cluster biosynthetic enzyme
MTSANTTLDDITEAMKDVIDPELGINVIDLGLVYDMRLDENNVAILDMTLTSAACPLQDVIEDQTHQVLADITSDVKINWVFGGQDSVMQWFTVNPGIQKEITKNILNTSVCLYNQPEVTLVYEESIHSQHWFGTHTYKPTNRWGYLTATFYGSQNGAGQFHNNCYSEKKLRAVCKKIGLDVVSIDHFQWKVDRDHMLGLTAKKPVENCK